MVFNDDFNGVSVTGWWLNMDEMGVFNDDSGRNHCDRLYVNQTG